MQFRYFKTFSFLPMLAVTLLCASCQQTKGQATPETTQNPKVSEGNFFDKLGNAVAEGVKAGIDNGIETSGSVGVLGYVMMPSKLANNTMQPAYCLENPVTHKIITVAPMFGRPYARPDGTVGFEQTTQQVSQHTGKIEVNLNGVLPGSTCQDLVNTGRLIAGYDPSYYYGNGYYR